MLGLASLDERRPEVAWLLRALLAFWAGWLGSLALPPVGLMVVQFPAFSLLIALLRRAKTPWGGFGLCWAYAFGFHLFGLSWIGEAFLIDAATFAWMRPFAVSGLPAGLALITGFAGMAFVWVRRWRRGGLMSDILVFAALFMISEWLRGHILTGFPWNLPVHGWNVADAVLQGVAWIGPYGVSLAAVIAAGALLPLLTPGRWPVRAGKALLLAAPLLIIAIAGTIRLVSAPAEMPTVPGVMLRLVQPNIPQKDKWRPELQEAHFQKHLDLSRGAAAAGVTHILWPEAATAFLAAESPSALARIGQITPVGGATILGTPRRTATIDGQNYRYTNSVIAVTSDGQVVSVYDKHHLVPFGEYVPLKDWLPIDRLAPGHGGFQEGPGPQTMHVRGAPSVSPLICYEAIFPGDAVDSGLRPGWLLNLTNDAWFGTSAGPYQHLAIARLRSIELGMPLVRVASTGISAVIDSYGRIHNPMGIGQEGVIDMKLPIALPEDHYTISHDYIAGILVLLVLVTGTWMSRRHDTA